MPVPTIRGGVPTISSSAVQVATYPVALPLTVAGDMLLVALSRRTSANATPPAGADTWELIRGAGLTSATDGHVEWWMVRSAAAGAAGRTVNFTGGTRPFIATAYALTDVRTTDAFIVSGSQTGDTGPASIANSALSALTECLHFFAATTRSGSTYSTAAPGWTEDNDLSVGTTNATHQLVAHRSIAAPGVISADAWTRADADNTAFNQALASVLLIAQSANILPVTTRVTPSIVVAVGETASMIVSSTDADNAVVGHNWTQEPLDATRTLPTLTLSQTTSPEDTASVTPTEDDIGSYTLLVQAEDASGGLGNVVEIGLTVVPASGGADAAFANHDGVWSAAGEIKARNGGVWA